MTNNVKIVRSFSLPEEHHFMKGHQGFKFSMEILNYVYDMNLAVMRTTIFPICILRIFDINLLKFHKK